MRLRFSADLYCERGRTPRRDCSPTARGQSRAADNDVTRWIHRAQKGDADAFDRLAEHHLALTYHIALCTTGDADLAAESCQEAMLSAWRRIGTFSGSARDFRSWLARIVVNACIDRLRYERRRPPTVPLSTGGDAGGRTETARSREPSVEKLAEDSEMRERLECAIGRVPEPYRKTLVLHLCEFTYAEIATTLGVGVGTVASRLTRARGHLRVHMTGGMEAGTDFAEARGPRRERRSPRADRMVHGIPTETADVGGSSGS